MDNMPAAETSVDEYAAKVNPPRSEAPDAIAALRQIAAACARVDRTCGTNEFQGLSTERIGSIIGSNLSNRQARTAWSSHRVLSHVGTDVLHRLETAAPRTGAPTILAVLEALTSALADFEVDAITPGQLSLVTEAILAIA